MSTSSSQPVLAFKGIGPQDAEERVPAQGPYEIDMRFLAAAISGDMPGNVKTELPLFTGEGVQWLGKPYNEWAPEPFSIIPAPGPPDPFGGTSMPMSPPPMIRIMHAMSGLADILEDAFRQLSIGQSQQASLDKVEMSFRVIQKRIWYGLPPVSEARWKALKLDDERNIEEALATIQVVIDIFDYLRTPEIQGKLRHVYNKIWAEIDVFQDACNAVYTSRGEVIHWNLTRLWEQYNKLSFDYRSTQARSWVFAHLKSLYSFWKTRFETTLRAPGRDISPTHTTVIIPHFAIMVINKMLDMYVDADLYVDMRTEGLIFREGVIQPMLLQIDDTKENLDQKYKVLEDLRVAASRQRLQTLIEKNDAERRRTIPAPAAPAEAAFADSLYKLMIREGVHKKMQKQIDKPLEFGMESWVSDQCDDKVERFGFVIYRLSYQESDGQWKAFLEKLKSGLGNGWEGVVGAEKIRGKAKLHWVDGREKEIEEGDLVAARNSFNTFKETVDFPSGLSKTFFLAITSQALKSFLSVPNNPAEREGDYRSFLHAVSADFTSSPSPNPISQALSIGTARPRKYPAGYDGTFKIIDQLVWTDLFAMSSLAAQSAETYWALAAQHPWGVYVGPTNGVRRRTWREMRGVLGPLLEAGKVVESAN